MKVDLGTCAVCGAKNSKFVESCYKCGATLPWAPGFENPKPQQSAQPGGQPQSKLQVDNPSTPSPSPHSSKTVVPTPSVRVDLSEHDTKTESISERAQRRIPVPAWALAAGGTGCVAFGIALMMAFGKSSKTPDAPAAVVVPTLAPIASNTASTLVATPVPIATVSPAPTATVEPVSNGASVAVAATPGVVQSTPAAEAVPTAGPANGPGFDELYLNTTSGTPKQREAYWATVKNTMVSWRGNFDSVGSTPSGPLTIRCRTGNNSVVVKVTLSTTPPQNLPPMILNQSIAVEGVLSGYSEQGYELIQGRVN